MNETIKSKFKELKVVGQRFAIGEAEKRQKDLMLIDYLKSVIQNGEVCDFEDIGFCFWNISDNYALLKDGQGLFENHKAFYNFLKPQNTEYLYWLCCDATQRFTLEKDGYCEFWWEIYKTAVQENKAINTIAEYHAHRTALTVSPVLKMSKENLEFTLNSIKNFLAKQQGAADFPFYNAIFYIMQSRFTKDTKDILKYSKPFFNKLNGNKGNSFLCWEWKNYITPIDESKQANLVLNTAVNTLIYESKHGEAKELYYLALEYGLPKNNYIENRLG